MTCPHQFAGSHYCTYLRLPELLQLLPPAQTGREHVAIAAGYATLLWGDVEQHETQGLINLLSAGGITEEGVQDAQKRVVRLLAIDALCIRYMEMCSISLGISRHPTRAFSPPSLLALWSEVGRLADELTELAAINSTANERLCPGIQQHHRRITELNGWFVDAFEDVEGNGQREIVALADETLQDHHPYALDLSWPGSQDARTFIVLHQACEVWFRAAEAVTRAAIASMGARPARLREAQWCVERVAAILRLFAEMIRMPQTMSAADYLSFRGEIGHGSGAESHQFRAIEILLGVRDPRYRAGLEQMHLLTDELKHLFNTPSLASAFLDLAHSEGVIGNPDTVSRSEIARQLAALFLPTGVANPQADLMALAEGLLDVEQTLDEWRRVHLLMVDRMMGGQRPSLGVAGENATGGEHDSKPYLVGTLDYARVFPELWEARNAVQPYYHRQMEPAH